MQIQEHQGIRANGDLGDYLVQNGIVGIKSIDTQFVEVIEKIQIKQNAWEAKKQQWHDVMTSARY